MSVNGTTASLIVAIIALAGTIFHAVISTWFHHWSDQQKHQRELKRFFAKYQDAILLASQDLQSRLYNITDYRITNFLSRKTREHENLLIYTAFAVGQYLSWVYIIHRRAQFLQYETGRVNDRVALAVAAITDEWLTDSHGDKPFMLWKGDQMAIGEMMTIEDGDELCPIGYATFHQRWNKGRAEKSFSGEESDQPRGGPLIDTGTADDVTRPSRSPAGANRVQSQKKNWSERHFQEWFEPIVDGVTSIAKAKQDANANLRGISEIPEGGEVPLVPQDHRMRRLQHHLVDLINLLDPKGERSEAKRTKRARPVFPCQCLECCHQTKGAVRFEFKVWNLQVRGDHAGKRCICTECTKDLTSWRKLKVRHWSLLFRWMREEPSQGLNVA